MPFYPFADITQHGHRLLVSSLSQAQGGRSNEWFRILRVDADDADLVEAVMGAFQRSRVEDWQGLPQASAPGSSVDSERLGFASTSQMEASTTLVGLTLVDGEVFAAPYTTTPGRGYSGGAELPPAQGVEQIAHLVREALAEAARRSAHVVDHDAIAAAQDAGTSDSSQDTDPEAPDVRSRFAQVDNLAEAVLTRYEGRWAVESVSTMPGTPPSLMPNGWVQACSSNAELPATIAEGLLHSEKTPALPKQESVRLLLDALDATPGLAQTSLVRIGVEGDRSRGELAIWPQELDDEGWWQDPENTEIRVINLDDPISVWLSTIEVLADELYAEVEMSGRDGSC